MELPCFRSFGLLAQSPSFNKTLRLKLALGYAYYKKFLP
ncbi:conserved hypothetical protein [Vibrio cholerae MO10]|uniref:Uncharacterized protein n=1 Tax=Vibrio cholerae (strain MO10) TaxID=345072 RepID=A0A0X1KYZ3_VIBCO|nr:conserved hypothetical protein [Vibrio cholerae MO10]